MGFAEPGTEAGRAPRWASSPSPGWAPRVAPRQRPPQLGCASTRSVDVCEPTPSPPPGDRALPAGSPVPGTEEAGPLRPWAGTLCCLHPGTPTRTPQKQRLPLGQGPCLSPGFPAAGWAHSRDTDISQVPLCARPWTQSLQHGAPLSCLMMLSSCYYPRIVQSRKLRRRGAYRPDQVSREVGGCYCQSLLTTPQLHATLGSLCGQDIQVPRATRIQSTNSPPCPSPPASRAEPQGLRGPHLGGPSQ